MIAWELFISHRDTGNYKILYKNSLQIIIIIINFLKL